MVLLKHTNYLPELKKNTLKQNVFLLTGNSIKKLLIHIIAVQMTAKNQESLYTSPALFSLNPTYLF